MHGVSPPEVEGAQWWVICNLNDIHYSACARKGTSKSGSNGREEIGWDVLPFLVLGFCVFASETTNGKMVLYPPGTRGFGFFIFIFILVVDVAAPCV